MNIYQATTDDDVGKNDTLFLQANLIAYINPVNQEFLRYVVINSNLSTIHESGFFECSYFFPDPWRFYYLNSLVFAKKLQFKPLGRRKI